MRGEGWFVGVAAVLFAGGTLVALFRPGAAQESPGAPVVVTCAPCPPDQRDEVARLEAKVSRLETELATTEVALDASESWGRYVESWCVHEPEVYDALVRQVSEPEPEPTQWELDHWDDPMTFDLMMEWAAQDAMKSAADSKVLNAKGHGARNGRR